MSGFWSNALGMLMTPRVGSKTTTSLEEDSTVHHSTSSTHPSTTSSSSHGLSSKVKIIILVAIIVGGLMLLLAACCLVRCIFKRRRASQNRRRGQVAGRGWQKVDREEKLGEEEFPTNTSYDNGRPSYDPAGKERLLAGSPQPPMGEVHHAGENTGLMYEPFRPHGREGA